MALAHNLGFPSIGRDSELHKAKAAFRSGELDEAGLHAVGRNLRAAHWQLQKDAGIELLPVGDFAWGDTVLNHSQAFGVIPPGRHTLTGLADGVAAHPQAQWFDGPARYTVPELTAGQVFTLNWESLFEEVDEAHALGHAVKPVVIGPLTYLWLGKAKDAGFDTLELVDRLLPLYDDIFNRLAAQGVEWVQIDEPILGLDLPQDWKNAYERVYNILQRAPLKKLVATYFDGLAGNLGLAANLPVDGLHIDLVRAPEQYPIVLDRLPAYKVLSLGVVNGGNVGACDLDNAFEVLRHAAERLGDRLWVAPSCPLLHGALEQGDDHCVDSKSALAFAVQKCRDVVQLAKAASAPELAVLQKTAA